MSETLHPLASARRPSAPTWRAEPYRVFFPLAVLLGWAGIGHWAALATGVTEEYRSIFHALAMIQGFGTCLAIGFLFTFIPRRTGAPAPTTFEMAVAIILPVAVVAFAWREQWMESQTAWIALIALVASFIARRLAAALHVTFIGGFALLGLAVSIHVFLSHAGVVAERRGALSALVGLVALAILGRLMMDLDRAHFFVWMGLAAGAFLAATGAWAAVVGAVAVTPVPRRVTDS